MASNEIAEMEYDARSREHYRIPPMESNFDKWQENNLFPECAPTHPQRTLASLLISSIRDEFVAPSIRDKKNLPSEEVIRDYCQQWVSTYKEERRAKGELYPSFTPLHLLGAAKQNIAWWQYQTTFKHPDAHAVDIENARTTHDLIEKSFNLAAPNGQRPITPTFPPM